MNQNLFNKIVEITGHSPLQSEMHDIIAAFQKDCGVAAKEHSSSIHTNAPDILKANIHANKERINQEIQKKKPERNLFMIGVWRLENEVMTKRLG